MEREREREKEAVLSIDDAFVLICILRILHNGYSLCIIQLKLVRYLVQLEGEIKKT